MMGRLDVGGLWLLQVPKITVRKLNYIQIDVYMNDFGYIHLCNSDMEPWHSGLSLESHFSLHQNPKPKIALFVLLA